MIKLVKTSDTNWNDRVSTLLKVGRHGAEMDGLVKTAGAVLAKEFSELQPSEKFAWVHTLAIGSTEAFGPNRNADGFAEEWLKKKHYTFTKNANLFRNHQNKDPKKAIGVIKHSAYNPEMRRVELIVGYDKDKAPDIVEKVAKGEDIGGSMGCRIDHDVCSICSNKAPSPKQYCDCMKIAAAQILDDGRQVYVDNPDPSFFDWSYVGRPADRIAFGFQSKVASVDHWVSSVDLANEVGLWVPAHIAALEGLSRKHAKLAALAKLSEMEKEVPAKLTPIDKKISDSMTDSGLDDIDVSRLKRADLGGAMSALHNAQVLLPVKDFIKLISNRSDEGIDDISDEVQCALPGVFGRMGAEDCENSCFDGDGVSEGPVMDLVRGLIPSLGFGAEPLGKRITITVIRGPGKKASAAQWTNPLPEIETLAKLYATYKLAAITHPRNERDVMLTRAALLQHYHHSI